MAPNRDGPKPKRGDLIEIFCDGYQHWAVYVGDGYVVHVTNTASVQDSRAVVKKELLSKVAAGCKYRVNNKQDGQRRVRSPEEIIQLALVLVGHEWPYSLSRKTGNNFIIKLRYREPNLYQNRVGPAPKPGDLIEFFRGEKFTPPAFKYQHWAVYVGDGYVVHVTGDGDEIPGGSVMAASVKYTRAVVKKEPLSDVIGESKYRVNNLHDGKRRVRSPEKIVQMALERVGQEWPYNLAQKNCEHFVTELRYGEPICEQVGDKIRHALGFLAGGLLAVGALLIK